MLQLLTGRAESYQSDFMLNDIQIQFLIFADGNQMTFFTP